MTIRTFIAVLALALAATACSGNSDNPTPPNTATAEVTATTVATAIATDTTVPTAVVTTTSTALPTAAIAVPAAAPTATPIPPTAVPATPSIPSGGLPPPPSAQPPQPVTINVSASAAGFNTSQLSARSGATVTVNFRNDDAGEPHDLSFSIAGLGHGNTCKGPCSDSYSFTAPAAGIYDFFCTVHIDMVGTFTVTS